jgi:hypothetical protein
MRYVYSIIRFVPDTAKGEFVNIGAIAGSDATGEWEMRTVTNKKRARSLDDAQILGRVLTVVDDVERKIERSGSELALEPDITNEAWLRRLSEECNNALQFTEPIPIVAENADEVLRFAFRELVADPATLRNAYKRKDVAYWRARAAYLEIGIRRDQDLFERVLVHGSHYKDQFDFVVANGRAVQLAQAWSFQLPNQEELIRDLKSWAWTVRDIREDGGVTVLTTFREICVPSEVDVAAVFIPPLPDASTEALEAARALCTDVGIRLVAVEDVVPDVVSMARDLLVTSRSRSAP